MPPPWDSPVRSTPARRPRIAHVISSPDRFGGAEQVLAGLVEEGVRRSWDQVVLHPFVRTAPGDWLGERLHGVPCKVHVGTRVRDLPATRRWLKRHITAFGPDIVHAHLVHAGGAVAALRLPPSTFRIWTHHHGSTLRDQGRRIDGIVDLAARSRYDAVVAVSDAVARHLLACGYSPGRLRTIRNGWQGKPLDAAGGGRPTVVCVGHLRPEKGHDTLLRAFAIVHRQVPEARLVLAGDGPLRAATEALADQLGIASDVTFLGAVKDVWPVLAAADVFALASRSEPLGIAAIEAMAAGLPVVATAVGGLPEVVEDGVTGRLVPALDPAALAAALVQLLNSRQQRADFGERGRAAASRMHADRAAVEYFELYDSLLESASR
jgi:glycosyltransferase involved in cell wall biosynthesis